MKTTIVNFILDQSGSMDSIREVTIKGVNEYLNAIKKTKGKVLFSLTLFDGDPYGNVRLENPYEYTPIDDVKKLTPHQYRPSGSTPLYDAVCTSIEKTQKYTKNLDKPTVLNVVMTDGEENSSVEHNKKCLKDIIDDCEDEGNWTFVFLGANQDSWATGSQLGYRMGNTANWDSTIRGAEIAFNSLTANTVAFMASASAVPEGKAFKTANFNSLAKKGVK